MTALTANFDSTEFDVSEPVPSEYANNVATLAKVLQDFRDLTDVLVPGGSRAKVTSCYRDASRNATVKYAASDSQHIEAAAADVEFLDVSQQELASLLLQAEARGEGPDYSQCIFYANDNHVHIGIQQSGVPSYQKLVHYADGHYETLDPHGNINNLSSDPPDPSRSLMIKAPHYQGPGLLG